MGGIDTVPNLTLNTWWDSPSDEGKEEELKGEKLALGAASSHRRLTCSLVWVSSLPCLSFPKQASG